MFRLPTHLESFVPPPTEQVPQTRPWRGSFMLSSPSSPPVSSHTMIYCSAAETEGDNEVEKWPTQFLVQILTHRPLLQELQQWVKHSDAVPMCMFMPDRLPNIGAHRENLAAFQSLAKTLHDNQFIAIAPWNAPDRLSGGGLILYPTVTSQALLVGAVFLQTQFPDFLGINSRSHVMVMPVPRGLSYSPSGSAATPNIAASQRHARGGGHAR
ncbi:hypothetical protein EIP91_002748 [Steccherinum ochraceum]|uniref:Uncharacterized protein n=1 Tax=Steccherinum ochraceum TaxID=92696 RepID=A0A4R0RSC5_9APHY|nr:hypothetical protein EIP91_002748 [Steccherinum ochraceum]